MGHPLLLQLGDRVGEDLNVIQDCASTPLTSGLGLNPQCPHRWALFHRGWGDIKGNVGEAVGRAREETLKNVHFPHGPQHELREVSRLDGCS